MLKLFDSRQVRGAIDAPEEEKRYTRFPPMHPREHPDVYAKPLRRPCEKAPDREKRPVDHVTAQPTSLAEQLHSESRISVALLRRALPSRFAEMDAHTRELAERNCAELLSSSS